MSTVQHQILSGDDIHVIHALSYPNASARNNASGLQNCDIGKIAMQTDDLTLWVLTSCGPVTWQGLGDVFSTGSSIDHNIPQFNGTSGRLIEDSGVPVSSIANAVSGPASAVNHNVPQFNGTTGKAIEDSGVPIASVQQAIAGKWGTATDYSEFESNGVLHMAGGACVWDDYTFESFSLGTAASAPDKIDYKGGPLQVYGFDGGNSPEQLFGTLEIRHAYKEGSGIVPHIHWEPTTTNAGNAKWLLDYRWTNDGETAGAETTISVIQAAGGTAWKANRVDWNPVAGTGKKIGSTIVFRLYRNPVDAQDTYPNDAAFISFGFHYQKDTLGSRGILTK